MKAKTPAKTRAKMRAKTVTKSRTKTAKRTKPSLPARQTNARDSIDVLVAASARALGITLDPSWHPGVEFNLQLILTHAARLDGFALPDDAEPAPIFHA
jgi:hypothetical protein